MKSLFFSLALSGFALNLASQSLLVTPSVYESDKKFFVHTTTSLNTTKEVVETLTASQKLSCQYVPLTFDKHRDFCRALSIHLSANVINLEPSGTESDSLDLVSLMFPETGNAGLMLGLQHHFWGINTDTESNSLFIDASISLRQNKITGLQRPDLEGDTIQYAPIDFSALNYNLGFGYGYRYEPDENLQANFTFMVYLNFFNIPNEDANNFNLLFPADQPIFESSERSNINSFGVKFSATINGFGFYADLRNNYTVEEIQDDNPFKGFVFNAGFVSDLSVFSR